MIAKKYDLLTRKDAEALVEDTKREIEIVLASFGQRLTDLTYSTNAMFSTLRGNTDAAAATGDALEGEILDLTKTMVDALLVINARLIVLEGRTFTARWRALLRKLSWKRNGSPPSPSVTSSSSSSPTPPPTAWDVDKAWPTPSDQLQIF